MMNKEIQFNKTPTEKQLKYWASLVGKKQNKEQIQKRVLKSSGSNHWTTRQKFSAETKEKMKQAKLKNPTKYWLGKTFTTSETTKQKLREASTKNGNKPPSSLGRRKANPITPLNIRIRMSIEYKLWREAVFKRDDYTCIWCGQVGKNLNADHIKPFCNFPELRFAIDNGRTLCISCHKKTNTFGYKAKKIYE